MDTPLEAKGTIATIPAPLEDMRCSLDTEADFEEVEVDLQDRVPGVPTAGPGSAVADLYSYKRPEKAFDCCSWGQAAGYRSALALLPWACQPPRISLGRRL